MPNGVTTHSPSPSMQSLDPPTYSSAVPNSPPPPDYYELTGVERPPQGRMGVVTVQPVRGHTPIGPGGLRPEDPGFDAYSGASAVGGCTGAVAGPLLCAAFVFPVCPSHATVALPAGAAFCLISGAIIGIIGVKATNGCAKAYWDHQYGPNSGPQS